MSFHSVYKTIPFSDKQISPCLVGREYSVSASPWDFFFWNTVKKTKKKTNHINTELLLLQLLLPHCISVPNTSENESALSWKVHKVEACVQKHSALPV